MDGNAINSEVYLPPGAILVVDDEALFRQIVARALCRSGYRVLEADGGRSALDILVQSRGGVSLMITDLRMPGMDGLALIRQARSTAPGVPVVAMTGMSAIEELVPPLAELEVRAVLKKPFSRAKLIETVNQVLEGFPPPTIRRGRGSAADDSPHLGSTPNSPPSL